MQIDTNNITKAHRKALQAFWAAGDAYEAKATHENFLALSEAEDKLDAVEEGLMNALTR